MEINQGYEIIQEATVIGVRFVLGKHHAETVPSPYVTWEHSENHGYYWGHYFGDYISALEDLYARAQKQAEYIKIDVMEGK